jgi:hypothetical protein
MDLDGEEWERRFDAAYGIVADWRNIHGVPLKVVSRVLRQRALSVDQDALIAQRLKRYWGGPLG